MRVSPFACGPTRTISGGALPVLTPAVARRYPTLVDPPDNQYPEIVQAMPALRTPVQFGDLETVVVRITDDGAAHAYSTLQAFNADQSLVMLRQSGGVWVETETWTEVRREDAGFLLQFADPVNKDLWWGSYDWTNQIGRYNYATDTTLSPITIHPPSGAAYEEVSIGWDEGSISDDGRYIPVVCHRNDGNTYVAIFDAHLMQIENTLVLTGKEIGSTFDNAMISPSGTYLVTTGPDGHTVYDRSTLTLLYTYDGDGYGPSHADFQYRYDTGEECLIRVKKNANRLVSVKLADGTDRTEVDWRWFNATMHVTGRNRKRRGWVYVSPHYNPSMSTQRYFHDIYAVRLDGTGKHERWGQAVFPSSDDYSREAKATVSPYGDIVLFTSAWGGTTPRDYVLYVPESMPEPPSEATARLVSKEAGGGSTLQTASGQDTTAGSTFVVCMSCSNPNVSSVTDNYDNTYTLVPSMNEGGTWDSAIYVCVNGDGGEGHRVTVAWSGSNNGGVVHFIEIQDTSGLGVSPTPVHDTSSPYTASSGALSGAGELLLSLCASNNGGEYAAAGWDVISAHEDDAQWTSAVAVMTAPSADSVTVSWTEPGASAAHVHVVSFLPAA